MCMLREVRHAVLTEYLIVSTPAVTPVTTPPATVASALPVLHVPPVAGSVRVMGVPMHTEIARKWCPIQETDIR